MRAIPVSASGREDKITVGELCCARHPGISRLLVVPGSGCEPVRHIEAWRRRRPP